MYTRSDGIILSFSTMVSFGGDSTDTVSDWEIVSDNGLWSATAWSVLLSFVTDFHVHCPEPGARSINQNLQLIQTVGFIRNLDTYKDRDRKQMNIFERKVYRRILGPVYDNGKENWRILTNKEIYARVKNPTIIETIRLNKLCWFGHVQSFTKMNTSKIASYRSTISMSKLYMCKSI